VGREGGDNAEMKKRDSKRRWKARAAIGRDIPALAIVEHNLHRWFVFKLPDVNRDYWVATVRLRYD
jgi:hypothetical protein